MIITFLRSSMKGRYDFCEHSMWLEYVLGYKYPANAKAEHGNVLHKCLELLALCKRAKSEGKTSITEEGIGELNVDCPTEDIFERSINYYLKETVHTYTQKDIDKCREWLKKTITYKNGAFNPLNLDIQDVEKSFNITFKEDWAKYSYTLKGQKLEGYFGIKGNIDLVTNYSKTIVCMMDYKTGKRIDWATGQEKTYKSFEKDFQLQLYALALSHLYPDKDVIIEIFYINDGNVFTIPFDKKSLQNIKDRVIKQYLDIKLNDKPKLLSPTRTNWKCTKLCPFFKNKIGKISVCEYMANELKVKGMQQATDDNIKTGFNPDSYGFGGGKEGLK